MDPARSRLGSIGTAGLTLAICLFYLWTACSSGNPFVLSKTPQDYYGMLTEAFLAGNLHLNRIPDPALLALPDPYDNLANRAYRLTDATHDLSLYGGRYYLYFGAAPVLTLFAPFRLITGRYLPENLALAILMIATFLVSLKIVRRLAMGLPRPRSLVVFLVVLLLGLCNYAPFLLRRPRTYEVAIAAGAFFALLGIDALSRCLAPGAKTRWLLWASLAFGLAFASRPTQGLLAILMTAQSFWLVRNEGRAGLRYVACLWGPWLSVIAVILSYNAARFDNPLEFGMRYQITEWNQRNAVLFSPHFLPFNAGLNLIAPPMVGPEFPFFQLFPSSLSQPPTGHQAVEGIAGLLPCVPAALAAFLWPFWVRRGGSLEWTGFFLTLQAVIAALVVMCFAVASVRYQWDFLPILLVSTALAWLRLLGGFGGGTRAFILAIFSASVLYTSALNLGIGMTGYNDWFKTRNPTTYFTIERAFLPLQKAWLRLDTDRFGPATLTVTFPKVSGEGRLEALLAAGDRYRHDVVCVRYTDDDRAVFRFHHRGTVPIRSLPVDLPHGADHVVEIDMGSLIPVGERILARLHPGTAPGETERLSIRVDGHEVLNGRFDFIPSMPQQVTIGLDRIGNDQCPDPFSGAIVSVVRRMPGKGTGR